METIVMDLDGTLCEIKKANEEYIDVKPIIPVVKKLREFRKKGAYIIIQSSRNMRTFKGNIGKINAVTLRVIIKWLDKHRIPYDEIYVGKPWCGKNGFYVDDRAIKPEEFLKK